MAVLRRLRLWNHRAQELGIAQGVLARAEVSQARVDAGDDDCLAGAGAGGVEDVLERLRERALTEGHIGWLLSRAAAKGLGVGQRAAADAVFED